MDIKKTFKKALNNSKVFLHKHKHEIYAGLGISSFIFSVVDGIMVTPYACKAIEEKKEELNVNKLTPIETVKIAGKYYIPTALGVVGGVGFTTLSVISRNKDYAALASSYEVVRNWAYAYRDNAIKIAGEDADKKIVSEIAKQNMENNPPTEKNTFTVVNCSPNGKIRFYDGYSGRYFWATPEKIGEAKNKLNETLINDNMCSLWDWYTWVGLEPTELSSKNGWNVDNGLVSLDFSAIKVSDDDGYSSIPQYATEIDFRPMPEPDYEWFGH